MDWNWISPIKDLNADMITSWFDSIIRMGPSHPRTGDTHKALDIAVPVGTSVYAPKGGVVKDVHYQEHGGNVLILDHGDGFTSVYAHLQNILVKEGEEVRQGMEIAKSGNSGISSGPHLHWEVKQNGVFVDPIDLFDPFEDVASDIYKNTVDAMVEWMKTVLADDVREGKTWAEWGGPLQANLEFTGAPVSLFGTRLYRALDKLEWRDRVMDPEDFPTLASEILDIEVDDRDPLAIIGDAMSAVGQAFAFLLSPENWARVLALGGGAFLAYIGFRTMWEATNS